MLAQGWRETWIDCSKRTHEPSVNLLELLRIPKHSQTPSKTTFGMCQALRDERRDDPVSS